MLRITTLILMLSIAALGTGCGPSVTEACENAGEQCMLEQEEIDECVKEGEALEEEDKLNDEALDCLAEATSCDEASECPAVENEEEEDEDATE